MSETMLEVSGLTKRFGSFCAVDSLSFSVKRGEVFGFLGPNGAGKSTTMKMITGFIPATAGLVKVAGLTTDTNSLLTRTKIGYLPETTPLYGDLFVEEYLTFVGKLRGLRGAKLVEAREKMIETCALKAMRFRPIGHLSKGYRQRVGLAQAMIHEPELLILDEPMSGLDPNQIVEMRELIRHLGTEKTVVYCTHILPEVTATCDQILIINNGRPVAQGSPEEVTAQASARTVWRLVIKGAPLEKAIETFNTLPGVFSCKGEYESEKAILSIETIDDDCGDVLSASVAQFGWRLAELTPKKVSLEEVFTRLTMRKELV